MPVNMKIKIANALRTLSKQKSIDKITVKDLVELCGISRQTFYYHFQDILAVLEWSAEQSVEDALQFSLICNQPEEAMKKFIETVINNKDLLRNLFTSQKYEFVEVTVARAFESYLREVLLSRIPDAKMNYNEAETLVCFCASGIAGVLLKAAFKSQIDKDALAKQLCGLLKDVMKKYGEE